MSEATLYLVDDHPVVREGLAHVLAADPGLAICGEASTAAEALDDIARLRPNLVILDLNLHGRLSLDMIPQIIASSPGTRVLVMSVFEEEFYAQRALRAGARGYLMKHHPPRAVIEAIHRILAGKVVVSEALTNQILADMVGPPGEKQGEDLTDRELDVFRLIGEGMTYPMIAERLSLSVKTVESHVARIKEKIGAPNGRVLLQRAVEWVLRSQGTGLPL